MGAQGMKQANIAHVLSVSVKTVQRAKKKYQKYGDVEGGVKKRGPKGKLDSGMKDVIP